jgi:hypothetical protein
MVARTPGCDVGLDGGTLRIARSSERMRSRRPSARDSYCDSKNRKRDSHGARSRCKASQWSGCGVMASIRPSDSSAPGCPTPQHVRCNVRADRSRGGTATGPIARSTPLPRVAAVSRWRRPQDGLDRARTLDDQRHRRRVCARKPGHAARCSRTVELRRRVRGEWLRFDG